ncbi:MAG: hypothetical protein ABR577_15155 [Pyrinomonadaceae bacterium]
MKRILPALLAALAAFACACQPTPPVTNTNTNTIANANTNTAANTAANTNANTIANANNGNGNVNANASKLLPPLSGLVPAYIQITNLTPTTHDKCCIKVDPDTVKLDGIMDRVLWIVHNECDAAVGAQLIIDDFTNKSDPNDHSPFGNSPSNNKFTFKLKPGGGNDYKISEPGKGKPGASNTYTYTLKIIGTDGKDRGVLDPEVEVGFVGLKK